MLLLAQSSTRVRACSCASLTAVESLAAADAVFTGSVILQCEEPNGHIWRLHVAQAWKGVSAGQLIDLHVSNSSASCGYAAPPAQELLVYAYRQPDKGWWTTAQCSRTAQLAQAGDDLAALGPPVSTTTQMADAIGTCTANLGADAGLLPGDSVSVNGCAVGGNSSPAANWQIVLVSALLLAGPACRIRRKRRTTANSNHQ